MLLKSVLNLCFSHFPLDLSQMISHEEKNSHLWDGQSLHLLRPVLRIRAGVCGCWDVRPVERLEADLGAEEAADGLQRAAGVRGQCGVCQQV